MFSFSLYEILALVIAFIAFYIPWYYAYSKTLTISSDYKIRIIRTSDIFLNNKPISLHTEYALLVSIDVINPSNISIGFFNLVAYSRNVKWYNLFLKELFTGKLNKEKLVLETYDLDYPMILLPPQSYNGTFQPNSYSHFDILIYKPEHIESVDKLIVLQFNVTYKTIWSRIKCKFDNLKSYKCFQWAITIPSSGIEKLNRTHKNKIAQTQEKKSKHKFKKT